MLQINKNMSNLPCEYETQIKKKTIHFIPILNEIVWLFVV